jgi:predicted amidohydrolase
MFTTGYIPTPKGVAEQTPGPTLEWMRRTAARKGAAVAGSVAVGEGGRYYNRFYFVLPDGTYHTYDKKHLFTMGGEKERFSAGDGRMIFQYAGFRIMPLVCYDLRFPVWSRAAGQVDLILCVASWPTPRIGAWDTLLKARAIENQCYVAGVNRVGDDPYNNYNGHSAVIDFQGNPLAGWGLPIAEATEDGQAQPAPGTVEGREAVITAGLSIKALDTFRAKFPAWVDADKFKLL